MPDLTEAQSSLSVNIVGVNPATGTDDNFADVNSLGYLQVNNSPVDGYKATYSANIANLASASLSTDIFTISGSASKVIRVLSIGITGFAGAVADTDIFIIKRSSLNSGGTSSSVPKVSFDSLNSSATASVLAYTANPTTLGTSLGAIRIIKMFLNTNKAQSDTLLWTFGIGPSQAVVLRGVNELLAINLNGTTVSGDLLDIDITWTEE